MSDEYTYITPAEYQQKRYEIARDILSNAIAKSELQNGDGIAKLNESFIFNSIQVADNLLAELKYVKTKKVDQDQTSVRTLSSILKSSKKDENE